VPLYGLTSKFETCPQPAADLVRDMLALVEWYPYCCSGDCGLNPLNTTLCPNWSDAKIQTVTTQTLLLFSPQLLLFICHIRRKCQQSYLHSSEDTGVHKFVSENWSFQCGNDISYSQNYNTCSKWPPFSRTHACRRTLHVDMLHMFKRLSFRKYAEYFVDIFITYVA